MIDYCSMVAESLSILDPETRAAELVRLWNECSGREFPLEQRLFLQQLRMDTDPRLCIAKRETDGSVSAAVIVKRASRPGPDGTIPQDGFISYLAVNETHRRQKIASALMCKAREWLKGLGAKTLSFGADNYHLLPGRPLEDGAGYHALGAFLTQQGFIEEGVEYDLVCNLKSWSADTQAQPTIPESRYSYEAYRHDLHESLMTCMAGSFPGRWSDEIVEALGWGMKESDLMLALDTTDGSVVGFSRIYDEDSTILGPSVYWRGIMGSRPGGLGPMGVDASRRGEGIGLGLLKACVDELHRRGVQIMVIDWTDLPAFYAKLGFKEWKRYKMMRGSL